MPQVKGLIDVEPTNGQKTVSRKWQYTLPQNQSEKLTKEMVDGSTQNTVIFNKKNM